MQVARWIVGCIVVVAVIAIVWYGRVRRELGAALAAWGTPLAPQCVTDVSPADCASLETPLGAPPAQPPAAYSAAAAGYAVALVAQFSAATMGARGYPTVAGGAPVALIADSALDPAPFAGVWGGVDDAGPWVVVAFRGTASAADLAADAQYGLAAPGAALGVRLADVLGAPIGDAATPQPGGDTPTLHAGFAATFAALRGGLRHAIVSADASGAGRVFVAGHSLGAALAFYAAADIAVWTPARSVAVIGVAPPRAGNAAWAGWLAAQPGVAAVSLVNTADLVPSLPWSFMPALRPGAFGIWRGAGAAPPVAFAHVEPVAAFTALWPDAVSCHQPPAYAAAVAAGLPVIVPSIAYSG